ncbi:glycosyltransferase family 4 protein [Streptomyces hokutonensis]|uniref:glycosyltransferase family 4 protein n=1 Tax=Streptomyces hokutonensis TaxID=1306990 RepID=UPI0038292B47
MAHDMNQKRSGSTLRVALVHWAFPPTVGGVESHLWWYSRLLASQGHQVTVFTGTRNASVPYRSGVEVLHHDGLDLSRQPNASGMLDSLVEWFRTELKARKIQLVHGHNLHHFSIAPAEALLSLKEEAGLTLFHTYHSLWRDPEDIITAKPSSGWDVHFAVSEFLRHECARALDIDEVNRTYLGIDTGPYRCIPELSDPACGDPGIVLLPARLIPDKGADLAIEAMKIVVDARPLVTPHLVLMDTPNSVDFHGEKGDFADRLKARATELGIREHISFEQADVERMPELYRRARVVIHPSAFDEPMGLAPLEAMCAARPAIATRRGGLSEGVGEDGVYGYLVPPGDVGMLAQRIIQLLNDPEQARLMGKHGRERVLQEFDLEQGYMPRMLKNYRDKCG